jgi:hypothetical protein
LRKYLIIPDIHAPRHDKRAWNLLLKVGRWLKPSGIIQLVSSHRKNPDEVAPLVQELTSAKQLRADLDSLGATDKTFIHGNHENRLYRYIADRAPALAGLVDINDAMGFRANKWKVVGYKDSINLTGTTFTHDLERCGKYAVHQAVAESGGNIVFGHLHRFDNCVEGANDGRSRYGLSPGWLGDWRQQEYKHRIKARREWHLGFAVGYRTDTKFRVVGVPIEGYSCLVEGRLFNG